MASDGLDWHASCRVDKYSADQVAWLRKERDVLNPKAADFLKWGLTPEDGVVELDGNLLVTAGLSNITALLTGSAGVTFSTTQGVCGVGSFTTAATVADVALGGNGSSATAWYQALDSAPVVSGGQISAVSTFGSGVANFAWNEWCWAAVVAPITAGAALASVGTTPVMFNHKVAALGSKISGSAWTLNTSVVLS